jgi:hypothetical protein
VPLSVCPFYVSEVLLMLVRMPLEFLYLLHITHQQTREYKNNRLPLLLDGRYGHNAALSNFSLINENLLCLWDIMHREHFVLKEETTMDFLRDPSLQFLITTLVSIAGVILTAVGIFRSADSKQGRAGARPTEQTTPYRPGWQAQPTYPVPTTISRANAGCLIVPGVILIVSALLCIIFAGPVYGFISNIGNTIVHPFNATPNQVLENFCSGIASGAYQEAYDQYSHRLQSEVSSSEFTQMWSSVNISHCTPGVVSTNGSSAMTTLTIQDFFTKQITIYRIILIQDGSNGWKIDSLQQQH